MNIELKAPVFPESVADGSIVEWHKKPGDIIKRDEVLVDIETDKILFEVPAIANGVLKEIVAAVGETVVSQQILAILSDAPAIEAEVIEQKVSSAGVERDKTVLMGKEPEISVPPAARNLIKQHGIDSSRIKGTGKKGRILKEDVLNYIADQQSPLEAETPTGSGKPTDAAQFISGLTDTAREKRVPMTRLRARIAQRLVEVQHTAAILTTFNEVNMQPVMDLRKRYKEKFEQVHGVKLGFMSFFVKASVEALKRFPAVNAAIEGNDIVYHNYFDIGIAVGSPRGLVVPILRNTEMSGLAEIERQISDFAGKANAGSLALEDITGGTFTITNGGVFGSMMSTPILNPPQSAILGMHKIEQRAVVVEGNIIARPMMYLALSYDHRIIDGQEAVLFLVAIKDMLEDPARIILEI